MDFYSTHKRCDLHCGMSENRWFTWWQGSLTSLPGRKRLVAMVTTNSMSSDTSVPLWQWAQIQSSTTWQAIMERLQQEQCVLLGKISAGVRPHFTSLLTDNSSTETDHAITDVGWLGWVPSRLSCVSRPALCCSYMSLHSSEAALNCDEQLHKSVQISLIHIINSHLFFKPRL